MTEFGFRSGRILCMPPWQWFGSRKLSSYGIHMTAVIQLGLDVDCCHAPGSHPHGHRARNKLYTTNRTHVRDRNYGLSNVDQDLLSLEEQCKTRFLFSIFHKTISVGTLVHHFKKIFSNLAFNSRKYLPNNSVDGHDSHLYYRAESHCYTMVFKIAASQISYISITAYRHI